MPAKSAELWQPLCPGRWPGGSHTDDDRIVAGEHHIDDDHRQQRTELIYAGQHPRHISIGARIVEASARSNYPLFIPQCSVVTEILNRCAALTRYLVHRGWE